MISQQKQTFNRDPFYVEPLPRAHYYPTERKKLSTNQKKTALSPNRRATRKHEEERLSYDDELFLKAGNSFTPKINQDDSGSSKFDESWPSTDRPLSVAEDVHPLNEYLHRGDQFKDPTLQFTERDTKDGGKALMTKNKNLRLDNFSTLQKYIDRFRSAQPTSREERQKETSSSKKDFWWLCEGSTIDSSSPKEESPAVKRTKRFTPHSPISPYKAEKRENIMALTPNKVDHTTRQLQEKADRLLDSASSVASSDPIVSTDGLGSSLSFNSTVSSVDEKPYRPSFARKWEKQEKHSYQIPKPQGRQPNGPEEDVLYQWRLKRRMEQARDSASKAPTVKFGFKDKPQGQKEIDQKLDEFKQRLAGKDIQPTVDCIYNGPMTDSTIHHGAVQFTPAPKASHIHQQKSFPIASPALPRTCAEDVKPHFHLTCDLLPCSHINIEESEIVSTKQTENSKVINKADNKMFSEIKEDNSANRVKDSDNYYCEKDAKSDRYKFLEAEKPDVEEKVKIETESISADGKIEENCQNFDDSGSCMSEKSYKNEDRRSESSYTGDKIGRDLKNKKREQNKATSPHSSEQKERRSPPPVLKQSWKPANSKNVDSAIGAVVKDRLFNISTSTVVSSMDSEASSPPRQLKSALKKHRQPEDQAEDSHESDGEFGDDQLLCMLRQQRAQFEDQLSHIDGLLARLDPEDS